MVFVRIWLLGSAISPRIRRVVDCNVETADRTTERADSASRREDNWERRSSWRLRTSDLSCFSRRRIPSWSFSAVDAAEPVERAWEEKRTESKSGERKREKTGSEAKELRGLEEEVDERGVETELELSARRLEEGDASLSLKVDSL